MMNILDYTKNYMNNEEKKELMDLVYIYLDTENQDEYKIARANIEKWCENHGVDPAANVELVGGEFNALDTFLMDCIWDYED